MGFRKVAHAFALDTREQFPTSAAYRSFLRLTGQTNRDVVFRVRLNLIYDTLIKKTGSGHAQVLDQQVRKQFGPSTICAHYYVMADCAGNRPQTAGRRDLNAVSENPPGPQRARGGFTLRLSVPGAEGTYTRRSASIVRDTRPRSPHLASHLIDHRHMLRHQIAAALPLKRPLADLLEVS